MQNKCYAPSKTWRLTRSDWHESGDFYEAKSIVGLLFEIAKHRLHHLFRDLQFKD